jgi:hypothetical protein
LNLTALTGVQVAHVCFGGLGVLAFARSRRLGWSWATLAAVAYLFFGGFYGEAEHADIVRGFSYLPWLTWTLTPPSTGRPWTRLALLPPLAWVIATGACGGARTGRDPAQLERRRSTRSSSRRNRLRYPQALPAAP